MAHDWSRLAGESGSPFLTHGWLGCRWRAFGWGEPMWPLLRGADGSLEAGALLERTDNDLTSAADVYRRRGRGGAGRERAD